MLQENGEEAVLPMADTLIVFAREPKMGRVKQRLASEAGAAAALAIYRRLLDRTLRTAHTYVRHSNQLHTQKSRLIICGHQIQPGGRLSRFSSYSGAALQAQQGEDQGQRMHNALRRARLEGAQRAVLIGCDCPQLRLTDLRAAFSALHEAELVVSPTRDGGYCLIGASEHCPDVFDNIPWGTDQVLSLTQRRAAVRGWSMRELALQSDIDHLNDWRRWQRERARKSLSEHAWEVG